MNQNDLSDGIFKTFKQLEHEYIGYQSLTDVPKSLKFNDTTTNLQYLNDKPLWEIIDVLKSTDNIFTLSQLWGILLKREGSNYEVSL